MSSLLQSLVLGVGLTVTRVYRVYRVYRFRGFRVFKRVFRGFLEGFWRAFRGLLGQGP